MEALHLLIYFLSNLRICKYIHMHIWVCIIRLYMYRLALSSIGLTFRLVSTSRYYIGICTSSMYRSLEDIKLAWGGRRIQRFIIYNSTEINVGSYTRFMKTNFISWIKIEYIVELTTIIRIFLLICKHTDKYRLCMKT